MMSTGICRWLFLLISLSTWTTITNSKEMRVVCYYTNWSVYRPGAAKFNPQNINPYLCTHLIYAFGGFTKENTLKPFDKYQDIEKGGYAKFTGLKTYNKNLKTMLAIGGWNEGSSRFSPMVANAERRKELVRNTIKFLRQNHFDGLDLDWEYPTFRDGGKSRDRDNYAQLVEELREEFERESEKTGRPRLLLTMAVPAGIEYINKGYDVPKLMQYLDWMNILSYDYHSAFEPAVNHHAPLYSLEEDNEYNYDAELNIDYTVKHYMKLGADPHKLVLGIPTYGRSYTLYNPDAYEIGSPADGPGDMGEATRENGYLAYYEICDYVKNQGWEVEQPNPNAMGPYAYKDNQWVGYDDEEIVKRKSEYVAENELGGIMFWAIDNDDFRGDCHGKPYPLIEAAKEALLNAYGLTDDNLISPPSKPKSRTRPRTKTTGKVKEVEEETKVEKVSNSGGSRRRIRPKSKSKVEGRESTREKHRRKEQRATTTEEPTTHTSLKVATPSYTTPAPPSTPELDGAFKCEDEGFFPHPKDCKKYFWCLSGAADSGIVAHQFTCPAGLYFNKAADSCDYTQNVLCNKKLQRPTTSTTASSVGSSTTSTTPASALFSTSRAPPKITAATSRTTFRVTTTTEAYDEDEYEYDDEEEEEDEKDDKGKSDTEEDPRVIKELIELIKKAGGIEELEKQLSGSKTSVTNPSSDSTTPSGISKSLYERVLNKAVKNTLNSKKISLTALRNSRGPQNDGLSQKDESSSSASKTDRGKLQYTSISRKRPSTEKAVEDDTDDEKEEEAKEDNAKARRNFSKKFQPEYVTIRRPRVSSTTEASESDSSLNRNKILGETSDEEYDDDDDIDEDEDDDVVEEDTPTKKQYTPQYVNIRRQRPSTPATDESTTSKYTVIRRGSTSTTESASEANEESTTSKYKTIKRGSTASPTSTTEQESSSSRFQSRRGTTVSTTPSTVSDGATSRFKNFRRGSTTPKAADNFENTTSSSNTEISATTPLDDENDVTPRSSTITRSSTETSEINTSGYQVINRSSTTAQSEVDTIATVSASVSGSPLVTSTETASTALTNDEDKITTLANIIDDIAIPEPSSTATSGVQSDNKEQLPEINKLDDSTEPAVKSSNSSAAEVTDNETETSQKNNPQLSASKPFSVLSRGSSTVKSVTEPTIQNSKVSQSNFKFRLKPKTLDSHDTSNDHTSTSETPVLKNNYRIRNRGNSRFTSNSQNVNKHEENIEEDADSKVKVRKRISTTEKYIEENRTYRPSELADLSSLTAVDFAKIKELNLGRGTQRRRGRPNTVATTTEEFTEEVADESLKTSSRTLPLARKLIENTPFGANRRLVPKKIDQVNSSSEINITKKIRGFASRTTRQPSTTETIETLSKIDENPSSEVVNVTPRSRRVVRRFRTTTPRSVLNKDVNANGKSLSEIQPFRRRTFITKNENSTEINENSTVVTSNDKQTSLQKLFSKKPTRLPFVIQKNDVEEENDDDSAEDSSTEEGENIKLSESNIRENSDVNSYDIGGKQRPFKLIRPKSDILHGKINSEKGKTESGKGILPISEEIPKIEEISENKTIENITSPQHNSEITSTEAAPEETTIENISTTTKRQRVTVTSTQPSVRTRKIIRKLKPTTATITTAKTSTKEATNGRKRKIIRRLRPTSTTKVNLETSNLDVNNQTQTAELNTSPSSINHTEKEVATKYLFRPSLTRPKSRYVKLNLEKETTTEATEGIKAPVRIGFRKVSNRNTSTAIEKNDNLNLTKSEGQDSAKHLFRPKVSDLRSKYKGLGERKAFKPFIRSTTTVKNEILTTESTTENIRNDNIEQKSLNEENTTENIKNETAYEQKTMNEETSSEKYFETTSIQSQYSSTLDSVQVDSISKTPDLSTETVDKYITTLKTTDNSNDNYFIERNTILATTAEELSKVTETITENSSATQFTEASENINETTPTEEEPEDIESSTTIDNFQASVSPTKEDIKEEDHTIDYAEDDHEDEIDNEEDTSDDPEKGKRNYISIFRSSSTSNSFKDFDSETEMDAPKFEDLFEDKDSNKDLFKDEVKFEDHTEYSKFHYNDDDDDDFYKFDDDSKLVGDTSTEFKNEFSFPPNDVLEEEKTEAPPIETSSIKNHLYHPHRPAFIRPKITFSTTEKQTPQRPKYKTFSRLSSKTLEKETIKINTFNDTDDGTPEKVPNKVLFTNRYKYKTLERSTSLPEIVSLENDTSFEDDSLSEGTTTFLHILNVEESIVTTEGTKTKSAESNVTESNFSETTTNEESTATSPNLEIDITTQINSDSMENEFELTTVEINTLEPSEMSTVTNDLSLQTETIGSTSALSTTEQSKSEQTEQNLILMTASTENTLEPLDTTTEIPSSTNINLLLTTESNQTKSENITTTASPETTTPYRRRSTLKPINSRPKFTPIKRKNAYAASSTEQNEEGSRKNKFYRNRYQKSTTESVTPDSSDISHTPSNVEKSSTSIPINKFLYRHSTTKKPEYIKNSAAIEEPEETDDKKEVDKEKLPQYSGSYAPAFNERINSVYHATPAVPINEFIFTRSTTEINNVNDEESNIEEASEEDESADNDGDKLTQEDAEDEVDENVDDAEVNTSSESSFNIYRPRLEKPKPARVSNIPVGNRRSNSPVRVNSPFIGRSTTARVINRPVFGKTTETPKITEDLTGIDTEAVKNRNKHLFSKHRKVNSPVSAVSENSAEESDTEVTTNIDESLEITTNTQEYITLTPPTTESVTKASITAETTEYLTTLHHIFAEVNDNDTSNVETTTESLNSSVTSTTGKIERLIEVNRIVQVKTKEGKRKNHVVQEQPTADVIQPVLDKIGEVNRITVIKVVDGNDTIVKTVNSQENEIKQTVPISPVYIPEATTTENLVPPALPDLSFIEHPAKVEEVPAPSIRGNINLTDITVTIDKIPELLHTHSREDRKFEISSKTDDLGNINQIAADKKTEIIDGISHINVITPRPVFTEATTIALEGLFQTESTQATNGFKNAPYDELLETEHSKFVNVRVLHPDGNFGKGIRDNSKLLPIKLLNQDEEVSLRAKVIQVQPKSSLDTIKIVPIKVEMSRRISDSLPILRVTPQDTNTEYT